LRFNYSDDEYFPGQFALWQANCWRSLQGKAGQAALRELERALLSLPSRRLIEGALQDATGDVCAIGALARHRGVIAEIKASHQEMEEVGVELGMPRLVAWKLIELNDVELSSQDRHRQITPEQRYERVLAWVQRQLAQAEAASGTGN
jgi:hypothetical protein